MSKEKAEEELAKRGLTVEKIELSDEDWEELYVPTGKPVTLGSLLLSQYF